MVSHGHWVIALIRSERAPLTMVSQDDSVACLWSASSPETVQKSGDMRATRELLQIYAKWPTRSYKYHVGWCWMMLDDVGWCWHVGWRRLADNADKARRCRHGFTPWRLEQLSAEKEKALRRSLLWSNSLALVGHGPDGWSPVFGQKETRNNWNIKR